MADKNVGELLEAFCKKNQVKMGGSFLHFLVEAGKVASSLQLKEEKVLEALSAVVGKDANPMYVCPSCESSVLVEYGACPTCGTELIEGGAETPKAAPAETKTTKKGKKEDAGEIIREKIAAPPKLVVAPKPEEIKKMKLAELQLVAESFNIEVDLDGKLPDIRKAIIAELEGDDKATIKDIKKKKNIKIENVEDEEELDDEEETEEEEVEEKPAKKGKKASKPVVEEDEEEEESEEVDDDEFEEEEDEFEEEESEEEEDDSDDSDDEEEEEEKPAKSKKASKKVVEEDEEEESEEEEELDEDEFEEEEEDDSDDEGEEEEEDDSDDDSDDEGEEEEEELDEDDSEEEEEEDEPAPKKAAKKSESVNDAKDMRAKAKAKAKELIVDFKANIKLVDKAEQKDLILVLNQLGVKENVMKLDKKALAQKVKDTIKAKK